MLSEQQKTMTQLHVALQQKSGTWTIHRSEKEKVLHCIYKKKIEVTVSKKMEVGKPEL